MPKRTTPAAPAPEISLPVSKLIEIAHNALSDVHRYDPTDPQARYGFFFARLIGSLPDAEGDALATALEAPHLVSTHPRAAA